MIHIIDKHKCCGCSACAQVCPKQCISMSEDEEGFLYPQVNVELCINCGLCEKACPYLNAESSRKPLACFAAYNYDCEARMSSSSGGVFNALATSVLDSGGVVFGARFDGNFKVEHAYVDSIEQLPLLMGSKYVQSDIGNTYAQCRQFLKEGRQVLFTGTSCQIMGLKKFLKKAYANLLAVDVICHGVPSPGIWRQYVEHLNRAACKAADGKNTVLSLSLKKESSIEDISFRDKKQHGWEKYCFVVRQKSALKADQNSVLLSDIFYMNPYMNAFLSNLSLRPSCYHCPAKDGRSCSDMTIADFWGVGEIIPNISDKDKGVSAVLCHNEKAQDIIQSLGLVTHTVKYEDVLKGNSSYAYSVAEPRKRMSFFEAYAKGENFIDTTNRLLRVSIYRRLINRLIKILNR